MTKNDGIIDQRIISYTPLVTLYQLELSIPRSEKATATVSRGRKGIENILDNKDSRKVVIVGPCSIDDPKAALEYAAMLKDLSDRVSDKFLIVMRTYFEKPRTSLGWEGLIPDPDMDGSGDINKGYHLSRQLLSDISGLGLPCGTEYVDAYTPQCTGEFISWATIGARTAYSPSHRKMASGLSMPTGIKNDTHNDISVAVNGVCGARKGHSLRSWDKYGAPAIIRTSGNPYTHIILRGGDTGPNYNEEVVKKSQDMLKEKNLHPNVVIDCSHDNSGKNYSKQPMVFEDVIRQIRDGNKGIVGLMLESYLKQGSQKLPEDLAGFDRTTLRYGISKTDGCMDWKTTELLIMDNYNALSRTIVAVK
jgi:3-deoxy-7-phosphoheptulonate synthase